VIANPNFGFLVSESGSGFTWSLNSHENQLTPWSNDHVMDTPGEAIYVRDEATGEVWTPTALPIRDEAARTWRGTDKATAVSSMARTAFCSTWCSSCLPTIPSRFPDSRFKIIPVVLAAFP
jgi:hypothetical protein